MSSFVKSPSMAALCVGVAMTSILLLTRYDAQPYVHKEAVLFNGQHSVFDSNKQSAWTYHPPAFDYTPLGPEYTNEPWWEQFETNRTVYVRLLAGTCNVIRTIASALRYSFEAQVNVKFIFDGKLLWSHLFSFPTIYDGYTFPDGERIALRTKSCPSVQTGAVKRIARAENFTWGVDPYGSGEKVMWFFRILKPATHLQDMMNDFKARNNWSDYLMVGVHIRHTDNFKNMITLFKHVNKQNATLYKYNATDLDSLLPIENYIDRMRTLMDTRKTYMIGGKQRLKDIRFFLATDVDSIRDYVVDQFEDGMVQTFERNVTSEDLRKDAWGVQLGVIDLFLLASCSAVIGTPFSSFTSTATYIRGIPRLDPEFGLNVTTAELVTNGVSDQS